MIELLNKVNDVIINPLIILLMGIALFVFLWGIAQFLEKSSNEEARTKGKRNMYWGLIGFIIMIAVFAIINLILGTFGISKPPGGFIP